MLFGIVIRNKSNESDPLFCISNDSTKAISDGMVLYTYCIIYMKDITRESEPSHHYICEPLYNSCCVMSPPRRLFYFALVLESVD
jgi:hypothetical protein